MLINNIFAAFKIKHRKVFNKRMTVLMVLAFFVTTFLFCIRYVDHNFNVIDLTSSSLSKNLYQPPEGVVDDQIEIRLKPDLVRKESTIKDATFFTLCRNSDFDGIKKSIESVEEKINGRYHYPWVFANDEPFDDEFKDKIEKLVSGDVIFTVIPKEYWQVPEFIDQDYMHQRLNHFTELDVMYGGNLAYRQMCRFNSGYFYKLKALAPYNWYWRVEPNIKYACDILDDFFQVMVEEDKTYGFVLAMTEDKRTVDNLWETSRRYFENRNEWNVSVPDGKAYELSDFESSPLSLKSIGSLPFIEQNTDTNSLVRGEFNYCHYWSNFEIGNLNFFRGAEYEGYFDTLDKSGGFFYERWGDAPVHSIAVSYLLPPEKIQYFDDTGYHHEKIGNCPRDRALYKELHCSCSKTREFSWKRYSCVPRWFKAFRMELPNAVH